MQRPVSVSVLAVLNIVFGAIGIVSTPVSLFMTFKPQSFGPMAGNTQQVFGFDIMGDPTYRAFMLVSSVLGIAVTIALLAAGIGLLKLKPWARTVSIGYAIYAIVAGLAGWVFTYFYIMQPMMEKLGEAGDPAATAARFGFVGGSSIGMCFGLAYPIVLLVFMFMPNVKQAFRPTPYASFDGSVPPPLAGEEGDRFNE